MPIYANPAHFEFPQASRPGEDAPDPTEEPKGDPKLNIIFELNVSISISTPFVFFFKLCVNIERFGIIFGVI